MYITSHLQSHPLQSSARCLILCSNLLWYTPAVWPFSPKDEPIQPRATTDTETQSMGGASVYRVQNVYLCLIGLLGVIASWSTTILNFNMEFHGLVRKICKFHFVLKSRECICIPSPELQVKSIVKRSFESGGGDGIIAIIPYNFAPHLNIGKFYILIHLKCAMKYVFLYDNDVLC